MPKDQEYIGDGVYAAIEADMVKLHTPREHGEHFIYLGTRELDTFLGWLMRIGFLERWLKEHGWMKDLP